MTFLEGAFLAGLAAAAIPIILHLLNRRKAKVVIFPSLRFLREVESRTARRSRLVERCVLILRVLTLAFLALALARPVFQSGPRGRASRVYVIDNSMSMGARAAGTTALDRSLLLARSLVERMDPGDRGAVLAVHGDPDGAPALTESRRDLEKDLDAVHLTYRASPLLGAVERALKLLEKETDPVREVCLFSDVQASAFDGAGSVSIPEGMRVLILRPERPAEPNVTVSRTDVIGDGRGKRWVRASLSCSDPTESLARVRFSVGGKPVAERAARVPGGGEAPVSFAVPELPEGLHRAEIRTSEDALLEDNSVELCLAAPEAVNVLVLRAKPDGAFYVLRALASGGARDGRLKVRVADAAGLLTEDLSPVDVIVVAEPVRLEAKAAEAVRKFVIEGGGLLLAAGAAELSYVDALASRDVSPVELGEIAKAEREPFRLQSWNARHPILEPLLSATPPLQPDVPVFTAYAKVVPRAGAEVLARFSTGDPALILREAGRGRALFFASTLSGEWNNLPLRFLFAPLIVSSVRYLARGSEMTEELPVGTHLVVRRPVESGLGEVTMETVKGTRTAQASGAVAPGRPASPEAGRFLGVDLGTLDEPGIHILTEKLRDRIERRVLSVRPLPAESDLRTISEERLRAILPGVAVMSFGTTREGVARALSAAMGLELRNALLFAALLFLLLEPFAANRTAFRHTQT